MKKHYLKLLSFFLCFFLTFSFLGSYSFCFASSISSTSPFGDFKSFHTPEETWDFCSHYMLEIVDALTGLIPQVGHTEFAAHFRDTIRRNKQFENETECYEWMQDGNLMIDNPDDTSNYTEVYFSDEFLSILRDAVDTYKTKCDNEQVWRYFTTYTPDDFVSTQFPNSSSYLYFRRRLVDACSKDVYTIFLNAVPGYGGLVYHIDSLSENGFVVTDMPLYAACLKHNWMGFQEDSDIKVSYFDFYQNMYITGDSLADLLDDLSSRGLYRNDCLVFHNPQGDEVLSTHRSYPDFVGFQPQGVWTFEKGSSFTNNHLYFIISSTHQKFMVFESVEQLIKWQTDQLRPGYYQTDPSVSGNVATRTALNNGVNYGDIVGGDQWKIIIGPGNRVEPIVGPGSGGGGGGTIPNPDPGGGTIPNPDPGSGWNWDFSGLLNGLLKLIESLFNLISTLVGKIAELVASLINSVTSIINSLLDLFNKNAIGLLGNILSFLPADVTKLITLTFSLGCLIAIIKFFRG